ncbi:hypothetical protein EYF80_064642 [Liparis tanakae]|uniref:Uncharacterized protein n=1 Tax=Liparis tanakae TaxID=230148 RepID=A0A4Z2E9I5_9TELE|nr:hypothetical protein EYF80_064642 [Liparis tanakae]
MRTGGRTGQCKKQLLEAGEIPTWQWLWSVSAAFTWDGFCSRATWLNPRLKNNNNNNNNKTFITSSIPFHGIDATLTPSHTTTTTTTYNPTREVDLSLHQQVSSAAVRRDPLASAAGHERSRAGCGGEETTAAAPAVCTSTLGITRARARCRLKQVARICARHLRVCFTRAAGGNK